MLYFPPGEWAVFSPRILNVELRVSAAGTAAGRETPDFSLVEIAFDSVSLMGAGASDRFFVGDEIPGHEALTLSAFFDAIVAASDAGNTARVADLWLSAQAYELLKRFLAELKTSYARLFMQDVAMLERLTKEPGALAGFSGYLQTSNLYKLVSEASAAARQRGMRGTVRFDLNTELKARDDFSWGS